MVGLKIINFECDKDLLSFIKNNSIKFVGSGAEGSCYQGKYNNVYKFFEYSTKNKYNLKDIITEDEIKNDSFAFPTELYSVGDTLEGYKARFISKDYFSIENTFDIKTISKFNFDNFSKAYKVFLKDLLKLSKENILIYDLPFNIMFDGNKMTAIDTCGYKKVKEDPTKDNISSLNGAMELLFEQWFSNSKKVEFQLKDNNIDNFINDVYSKLPLTLKRRVNVNNNYKFKK